MTIRRATPADHRAMAEVAAAAFVDDDVFGRFMYPHRREYPEDYISMWERGLWVKATDYTREYLVSVDDASGKVVAWAGWVRLGPGAVTRENPIGLRKLSQAHMYPSHITIVGEDAMSDWNLMILQCRPQEILHHPAGPRLQLSLAQQIRRPSPRCGILRRHPTNRPSMVWRSGRELAIGYSLHASRLRGKGPWRVPGDVGGRAGREGGDLRVGDCGVEEGAVLHEIWLSRGREGQCRPAGGG